VNLGAGADGEPCVLADYHGACIANVVARLYTAKVKNSVSGSYLEAASTGAANMAVASAIKTKDAMTLEYRLESADGRALLEKKEKRNASSDGEDLLTPLVQGAAENIVATLSSAAH